MIVRGKRANITPSGLGHIVNRALGYPRIKRTELAGQLQLELERMGYDVPEIEVLERKISWYRNHGTDNPRDKPWNLGTLVEYPIAPECLPAVLQAYTMEYILLIERFGRPLLWPPLTIRQALWVARLAPLIKDNIPELFSRAWEYAAHERIHEFQGKPLPYDTSTLDEALIDSLKEEICEVLGVSPNEKVFPIPTEIQIANQPRDGKTER